MPLVPKPLTNEPLKKSPGMTRKGFGELLKRAIFKSAPKPAPKST
jgi:hypothetical protein